ncbi:MAG: squalene/phytoene synthase family protein [Xanthobacteraceae bacterium]|nr:squalene/phytoene synthase family protein [Xanthobacteraceae bacterium]
MNADYEHCEALVRQQDRERFLSTLFAPAYKRQHVFALYAFDLEIAHVPDAVREPMAGEVRFQWWREAIAGERLEEAKANPVAAALIDTIRQLDMPISALTEMIDARQFDLLGQPMESRAALCEYLDVTSGKVVEIAARILDDHCNPNEAAQHAGRALGLTRIFRNFARDVARGRLFLPLEILAMADLHTASVFGGENSDGLRAALMELCEEAGREMAALRAKTIPTSVLPAFLAAALTPLYLARMRKPGYDPFRSDLSVSGFRSQFALWRAARSGKI